ncbi:MAG TPA: serine/threonine-protein kinase, partial [Streptomyces sp.]|nr:serine/threonine-protein kinase [Streptomyces sp.]
MGGTDRWTLDGSGAEPLKGDDPTRIGPVPLLGRLGAGGMGRVYLGVHEGRYVAVKQVLPSVVGEDEAFVRRFGHELDNLARLPADSTAALILSDLTAGPPWFATAYVPGLTLRRAVALSDGGLPGPALWLLLREAAAGLAAVHDLGMVHRDVKPSNVMLTVGGATLIDFGVARAADQSELTLSGMVVGTPAYMSPEQASGRKGLGSATDVFALGSVLTFAACGRPPFGDESGPAVLYRVVHEAPDTDALRIIDTELAEIVTACLDKDPERRPTAAELLRLAEGRTPAAPPLWPAGVTDVLERRAAFARTRPGAGDLPTAGPHAADEKGHTKKDDARDDGPGEDARGGGTGGAGDGGEPGTAREKTRTRVLFGVLPVVVVATGATLAFQLLPYAFDADDRPTAGPSASATAPASTGPTGSARPGRSTTPSPSASGT